MIALINSFSTMIIIYYLFFIFFLVIILIFSSKRFSPIPYFPSQEIDIPLIIKALNLRNKQAVFDLGAGDGIVVFSAAKAAFDKKLNTKFIAVEINPILALLLHFKRLFHPNKKNINIIKADMFKDGFWSRIAPQNDNGTMKPYQTWQKQFNNLTIYLYISPWFLEKVVENCKLALSEIEGLKIKNFDVVSYMYPIKSLKNKEHKIQGKNPIFIYS